VSRLSLLLAHGWRLTCCEGDAAIVREWIRPAIRAIPRSLAVRLPRCEFTLVGAFEGLEIASRWTLTENRVAVEIATSEVDPHDVAIEMLVCAGQALWEVIDSGECAQWLELLHAEITEGVAGEIDEQALADKRKLLSTRAAARSRRRLSEYARTSFAATVAEYVHCLWHDVTIRTGAEHLSAAHLRRRLDLMERWFPPNRGYRLFA
jgi:hypothetical protein